MSGDIKILLVRNKATKNTIRFGERKVIDAETEEEVMVEAVPQLYVTKAALNDRFGTEDVKAVSITLVREDE